MGEWIVEWRYAAVLRCHKAPSSEPSCVIWAAASPLSWIVNDRPVYRVLGPHIPSGTGRRTEVNLWIAESADGTVEPGPAMRDGSVRRQRRHLVRREEPDFRAAARASSSSFLCQASQHVPWTHLGDRHPPYGRIRPPRSPQCSHGSGVMNGSPLFITSSISCAVSSAPPPAPRSRRAPLYNHLYGTGSRPGQRYQGSRRGPREGTRRIPR